MIRRRAALLALASSAAWLYGLRAASASTAKAVSLSELVARSRFVVLATPKDAFSRWENIGGRRRIVTYSRVLVDENWRGPGDTTELLVRTLGGHVGEIGQVVHGEALLAIDEPALAFLSDAGEGVTRVTAMAQGHYPLSVDSNGVRFVRSSPHVAHLVDAARAAVRRLHGATVAQAAELVREAARK